MSNRGFEVELVLALHGLLMGQPLLKNDFQVINCATDEEKYRAFDKVVSRLLYTREEHSLEKVKNFKFSLGLIHSLKSGNSIIVNADSGPEVFVPLSRKVFTRTIHNYDEQLRSALKNLISGVKLNINEVLAISVAEEIELSDIFSLILIDILSTIDESLAGEAELNIFVLKSLKLTSSINVNGVQIDSISREEYEQLMSSKKMQLKKIN